MVNLRDKLCSSRRKTCCGKQRSHCVHLSCSIFVRIKESVIRSAMASPCWSPPHLLSSSHNTKHHLRSTTFSKMTLHTKNHSRKSLFQKLPGRKATLKNNSRTSIKRVAETCAQTLPQKVSPSNSRKGPHSSLAQQHEFGGI